MSGYLIRYNEILVCIDCRKWSNYSVSLLQNSDYNDIKCKHPYAEYKVYDLVEQLSGYKRSGGKLGKHLPKKIKNIVLELPTVKIEIRNSKLNNILE